jgi:hypothetical protein
VTSIETVRGAVQRLPDTVPFKAALVSLLTTSGNDLATFVASVEQWYDAKMDQIGGAYRRWAKRWLIVFGIAAPFDTTQQCVMGELDRLRAAGLPIGWSSRNRPAGLGAWLLKILGLAVTAVAATLGAPFWFDVLNRLGSLRNAGRPPRSSTS